MNNKKLFLMLSLSLTACTINTKPKEETAAKCLACYALEPTAKRHCVERVQFDLEKQGFKQFINTGGLPCDSINESPKFVEEKQAYLVKCKPNRQYLMQFNYDNNQWKLITGEQNE